MDHIKLVVSDIDGTFLTNSKEVTETNLLAISKLHKRGIPFVLASGRALGTLQEMMKRANALDYVDYYLYYNGFGIFDVSKGLNLETFKMKAEWNKEILDKYGDLDITLIDYDGFSLKVSKINHVVNNLINFSHLTPEIVPLDYFKENEFAKFMVTGSKETLDELWSRYNAEDADERYVGFRTSDFVYDFMDRRVSKFNAVKVLCEELNIDINEVLAFGDAENDYELLVNTPHSVAMANSQDEILKICRYKTKSNEESGVGDFILNHFK